MGSEMCIRDRAQVALRADGGAMPLGVVFHGSAGWAAADQAGTGYALPAAVVGECGAQVAVGDACAVSYTHLRAHAPVLDLVSRLLLET